ncbi:MAG TPA: hypothetical protein VFB96_16520 [Pirellulaceae bacterium]|nr:hypothetical protein [Pirellulaceae bacterium]
MPTFRRHLSAKCRSRAARRRPRRGLTLAELLVAGTVLVLIGGACATLAFAVYSSYEVCKSQATAAQHARVSIDRIEKAVVEATASESFPGCLIINYSAAGETFPDSLAVWRPTGAAVDPAGLPRVNELVVFSCDPGAPNKLLEMTWPTNTSVVPGPSNELLWRGLIDSFHSSAQTIKNQLTDRLRTGSVDTLPLLGGLTSTPLGMIRFKRFMAPSESQWSQYRGGQIAWQNINWPLDMYSTQTGLRTVSLQVELQIVSGDQSRPDPIPFLGSANLTYTLRK